MQLVGFRNRLSVLLQWGYNYLFYEGGVRLITETEDASMSRHPATTGRTGEYCAAEAARATTSARKSL